MAKSDLLWLPLYIWHPCCRIFVRPLSKSLSTPSVTMKITWQHNRQNGLWRHNGGTNRFLWHYDMYTFWNHTWNSSHVLNLQQSSKAPNKLISPQTDPSHWQDVRVRRLWQPHKCTEDLNKYVKLCNANKACQHVFKNDTDKRAHASSRDHIARHLQQTIKIAISKQHGWCKPIK